MNKNSFDAWDSELFFLFDTLNVTELIFANKRITMKSFGLRDLQRKLK